MKKGYDGEHCPNCLSLDMEQTGAPELENKGELSQEFMCNDCGVGWYEIYKLYDWRWSDDE